MNDAFNFISQPVQIAAFQQLFRRREIGTSEQQTVA